eukprot:980108-Pyramimonas_sp.AAC.1
MIGAAPSAKSLGVRCTPMSSRWWYMARAECPTASTTCAAGTCTPLASVTPLTRPPAVVTSRTSALNLEQGERGVTLGSQLGH